MRKSTKWQFFIKFHSIHKISFYKTISFENSISAIFDGQTFDRHAKPMPNHEVILNFQKRELPSNSIYPPDSSTKINVF